MRHDRPPYQVVADRLREQIKDLPVGAPVPSERVLAEDSGVSRMTARKAIDVVEHEGLVTRQVGRGSFVTRPTVNVPLRLTSFSEDMIARGRVPSSRVLRLETTPSDAQDAAFFRVQAGTPMTRLTRLRLADGEPLAIERSTLLAARVPGLDRFDLTSNSLYALLDREYGIRFDAGEQTIRAAIVAPSDAVELGVSRGAAVLELVRTSIANDEVIERSVATYPGARFELSAQIAPVKAQGQELRSALRTRG